MTAVVRTRELRRDYPMDGEEVHAVRGVSLDVRGGAFVAIVGPSGCGKSTLLNLIGAIDRPTAGTVEVDGRAIHDLGDREATRFRLERIGFVFQRFHLMPTLSALENVELPMAERGLRGPDRRTAAAALLERVGLGGRVRHRPSQLSGGEQQRVAIARALANGPALVLADEPTGELDARTGAGIIELLEQVNAGGTTLIVVTHDEDLARRAHRVIHMRDGRIIDDTAREPAR